MTNSTYLSKYGTSYGTNSGNAYNFGSNNFGSNNLGLNNFSSNNFGSNDFGLNNFGLNNFGTPADNSNDNYSFGYDPFAEIKKTIPSGLVSAPSAASVLAAAPSGSSTLSSSTFNPTALEAFAEVFDQFVETSEEDDVESMDQRTAMETLLDLSDEDYAKLDELDGEEDGNIDINVFKSADLEEVLGEENAELKVAQKYLKENEDKLQLLDESGISFNSGGQTEILNESFDRASVEHYIKGLDMLDAARVLRDEDVWEKLTTDDDVVCFEEMKIAAENTELSKEVRDAAKFFIKSENRGNFNALTNGNDKDCTKDSFDARLEKLEKAYGAEEVEKEDETETDEEE